MGYQGKMIFSGGYAGETLRTARWPMIGFYKARIYDPETGRFLQPDPVHTDQPGQDNLDRYQYVWNNPVNFVDPDGERSEIIHNFNKTMRGFFHNVNRGMRGIAHKFNGGLRGIAHKFNSSLRGITHNINNSVKTIGHKIDHAYKSKEATLYFMFKASGMTEEEIACMLAIYLQFADKGSAYFSHRYTGHEGNRDPFNGYYTDFDSFVIKMIVIASFVNQELGGHIDEAKLSWLLLMIPMLSPEPVSFADGLAVRHDREWPKNNKHFKGVFDANNH